MISLFKILFIHVGLLYVLLATTRKTLVSSFAGHGSSIGRRRSHAASTFLWELHETAAQTKLDGEILRAPITPVGNFVLVQNKETLSSTTGGILLPDQTKEKPTEGLVLAAGPGKLHPHSGVRITNPVEAGDSVVYGKFTGTAMVYNDEQVTMIRDDDILLYYKGKMMTTENAIPCRDYILVKVEKSQLETSSGIVVAETAMKDLEKCEGTVVKVGEGRMSSKGEFTAAPVKVGDYVKFKDYAGNSVRIEGEDYSLVRMVDILSSLKQ